MELIFPVKFIILAVVIIINIFLMLLVFRKNKQSATNILFIFLGILISTWLIILYLSTYKDLNLTLARLSIFIATPMTMSFFLLAHTIPKEKIQLSKKNLFLTLFLSLLVMIITLSPFAFTGIEIINGVPQVIAGPGMLPFSILTTFFDIAAVYILIKKFRKSFGAEKEQFRMIMTGILLMLGLIVLTILLPVIFYQNRQGVDFAPFYTLVFLAFTAYAIVKYRFLDVKIILKRSVIYLLSLGVTLSICGLIMIGVLEISEYKSLYGFIILTLGIILFKPIHERILKLSNKYFFQSYYNYRNALLDTGKKLSSTTDLNKIIKQILDGMIQTFQIEFAGIYLKKSDNFQDLLSIEGETKLKSDSITEFKDLYTSTEQLKKIFILDENKDNKKYKTLIGKLNKNKILIIQPLISGKNYLGFIFIGQKFSKDAFSVHDVQLLETLNTQICPSIANAKHFQQLKDINLNLEEQVEKQVKKIKTLYKMKTDFLSMSSHQLRTPLTIIIGMLDMIKSGDVKGKKSQEFASKAFDAASNLKKVINDILSSNELDGGGFTFELKTINLNDMLNDLQNFYTPKAQEKFLEFTFESDLKEATVISDPKIQEVFSNLIDNALSYTASGYVKIQLSKKSNKYVVAIDDTGIGITDDDLKVIFQKFTRGKNIRQIRPNGTGLGLFISKQILEGVNGKIDVKSKGIGQGSTFTVSIPIPSKKQLSKFSNNKERAK